MIRKEKICSSRKRTASTLFYTKRSRVSGIQAITDMDTGEEKRTGEVPTLGTFSRGWGDNSFTQIHTNNCYYVTLVFIIFETY